MGLNDCQAEACAIQNCLDKNGYNEAKCQSYVRKLYQCCDEVYARAEKEGVSVEDAKATTCPYPAAVKRKLKSLSNEKQ